MQTLGTNFNILRDWGNVPQLTTKPTTTDEHNMHRKYESCEPREWFALNYEMTKVRPVLLISPLRRKENLRWAVWRLWNAERQANRNILSAFHV